LGGGVPPIESKKGFRMIKPITRDPIYRRQVHGPPISRELWGAFVLAVGAVLRRYSVLSVKLRVDGAEEQARSTPFVFVGNNRYEIAGLEIGTRTSLISGRLWVCMAPSTGRRNLIRMALRTLRGRVSDHELNALEAEEIWVQTETRRVNVSTDGEFTAMEAPLHYRIRPRALGVVVPARNGERAAEVIARSL